MSPKRPTKIGWWKRSKSESTASAPSEIRLDSIPADSNLPPFESMPIIQPVIIAPYASPNRPMSGMRDSSRRGDSMYYEDQFDDDEVREILDERPRHGKKKKR